MRVCAYMCAFIYKYICDHWNDLYYMAEVLNEKNKIKFIIQSSYETHISSSPVTHLVLGVSLHQLPLLLLALGLCGGAGRCFLLANLVKFSIKYFEGRKKTSAERSDKLSAC